MNDQRPTPEDAESDRAWRKMQAESLQKEIRNYSASFGLQNLKTNRLDADGELRLWLGFGLALPNVFILKEAHGEYKALFVGLSLGERNARATLKTTTVALGAPTSGWANFATFLKAHDVDSEVRLSEDKHPVAVPDGLAIVIEEKTGDRYTIADYSVYSKTFDGQKALAICRQINQEFNQIKDRVNSIKRAPLPLPNLFHDRVCDG